jgi:hypothetical protein
VNLSSDVTGEESRVMKCAHRKGQQRPTVCELRHVRYPSDARSGSFTRIRAHLRALCNMTMIQHVIRAYYVIRGVCALLTPLTIPGNALHKVCTKREGELGPWVLSCFTIFQRAGEPLGGRGGDLQVHFNFRFFIFGSPPLKSIRLSLFTQN